MMIVWYLANSILMLCMAYMAIHHRESPAISWSCICVVFLCFLDFGVVAANGAPVMVQFIRIFEGY